MEVRNDKRLTVSQILSRSFSLVKDNIVEVLKVIGIFIVPAMVIAVGIIFGIFITSFLRVALMSSYLDIDDIFGMVGFGTFFLSLIVSIIIGLVVVYANAIITKIIDDSNRGNQVSWRSANSYIWERKWKIVGLNVLVWLMLFFFIIIFILLGILLSALTFGIGLIIFIPLLIAIAIIYSALWTTFNSILIVNDLGVTDAIRETFLLFRKGYFWSTIGYLSAIAGINIGVGILLSIFSVIPFLGFLIVIIGQTFMQYYLMAYITIYVLDRTNPVNNYNSNNYSNFNTNYNSNYDGLNNNINNDNSGLNSNYNNLNNTKEDSTNNVKSNTNSDEEKNNLIEKNNNEENKDNKDDNGGFIDPIN